jgi:hypothetical protein
MILARILDFLDRHKVASVTEIAHAVGSAPDAVRDMLQTLQRKGRVHRVAVQDGCGSSCRLCGQGTLEVYGLGPEKPGRGSQLGLCASRGH